MTTNGQALNIAIDASRTTVARLTGTEHYSLALIRHIIAQNARHSVPHHITLYFRDEPAPDLFPASQYVTQRVIPFPRMWTHLRFALAIAGDKPDVTFVPAHTLPFVFPGKAVVTVHDLGYHHFPQAHPARQRRYLQWSTRHSARRATRILADSRATARDLNAFYGTSPEKIQVVYPGVEAPRRGDRYALYERYGLPYRYFLFIGTLQPRKNIERIVQAYDTWRNANPDKAIALVLAGKPGWLFDKRWVAGVEDVYLPGYIADEDKGTLLHHALALVFPSLYEGFGFPVLEAMHCGTPVIASNTSSLPELVDEAGMLVDPLNVKEIAAALDVLTNNEALHNSLISKGRAQARQFTWERAATQALTVLEAAAKA